MHSLAALRKSASDEGELKGKSVEIGVVGVDHKFTLLHEEQITGYLDRLKDFKGSGAMEVEQ